MYFYILWDTCKLAFQLSVFTTLNIVLYCIDCIQTGLFWPSLGWGNFFKTMEDIDMKLTPLIKHPEMNLLLLSYLSYNVT